MNFRKVVLNLLYLTVLISFLGCSKSISTNEQSDIVEGEFIVELPQVEYPLPLVDNIANNGNEKKKRSIAHNPVVYLLRGINDVWKGTTDAYQNAASKYGPSLADYEIGNPIVDSILWKQNIQYCIDITNNRTDDETILAYLDEKRSKYYSVIDGFGPLTELYIQNSGAYVDLPTVKTNQILHNRHYKSEYNDASIFAGDENSPLGAVVRLTRYFRQTYSSTNAAKYLFSTPRPWRMNNNGEVNFLGTTYDTVTHQPTYYCVDYKNDTTYKIFDEYESDVKIVPGLLCSRKNHKKIYDDFQSSSNDLYSNTTENRRTDNGYPSGHTNAGVLVSLAYAYAFPECFSEMVLRGSQLGEDRIVAGMHSPVDVISGKAMALAIACAALNRSEIAVAADNAVETMYKFIKEQADSTNMSVMEFAHREIENPIGYTSGDNINLEVFNNNFYDDKNAAKELYRWRLTYGFKQDTTLAHQPPIVPKGAEVMLKSRFPYLTANQRRQVLYTTEIPSGYKIIDKTNGWGRIDLVSAADGYGAFIGNVTVNMDASLRRFNAYDSWNNNIGGTGCLIKKGSGTLVLTGDNFYSGGTTIIEGAVSAQSSSALGKGNVWVEADGTLEIYKPIKIDGNFTDNGGKIRLYISNENEPLITVAKQAKLQNSTLVVQFKTEIHPVPGDKFAIICGNDIQADFKNIVAEGYNLKCEKVGDVVYLVVL